MGVVLDGLALEEGARGLQGVKSGVQVLTAPAHLHVLGAERGLRVAQVDFGSRPPARAL
jgi:hypothetical protein